MGNYKLLNLAFSQIYSIEREKIRNTTLHVLTRTTSRCCSSVLHSWENRETGETVFSYLLIKIKLKKKEKKKILFFEGPTSDLCKSSIRNWRHLWYPSLSMSNV